jgi:hypothetical protein
MVGPNGLEPSTFPARRDALTVIAIDEFFNRTMRFPGLELTLAPPGFRQGWVFLLINPYPRASTSSVGAVPTRVITESDIRIYSGTNIEVTGARALQNVEECHKRTKW